jgi:hypothetical protein
MIGDRFKAKPVVWYHVPLTEKYLLLVHVVLVLSLVANIWIHAPYPFLLRVFLLQSHRLKGSKMLVFSKLALYPATHFNMGPYQTANTLRRL